jgi:hypothetical protein
MRLIIAIFALTASLAGCTVGTVGAGIGAITIATIAYDDKTPFDYAAKFFAKRCENQTYMDQTTRCRNQ